jgi:Asp-tRNA(Asn)/Glu-tRNA(Gln) amidotransferase A subunit family amidase
MASDRKRPHEQRTTSYLSLAPRLRTGETSVAEELETRLKRLDAAEAALKAFVHVARDAARAAAKASDARWRKNAPLSPIDGMPVAIKDIIETFDMPTGQGSPMWEGFATKRDAAAVQALREAGAIILGKTTTTEFASSHPFAPTTNPHDPTRTPGGSSSGSAAAVGAGRAPAALGTQVVGSTLRPASFCGCVGLKPTFGALNRGGSYDYLSQSATGVIAATPNDAWIVASAIALRVGGDPGFPGLIGPVLPPEAREPRRLVVLQTAGWSKTTEGARAAFDGARKRLSELGIELIDRSGDPDIEALEQEISEALPLTLAINAWESAWPLGAYEVQDKKALSAPARQRLADARKMTPDEYRGMLRRREDIRARYAFVAARADAIVTLGATGAAPVGLGSTGDTSMNVPASLLGTPAISLPLLHDGHMPLGLQLIGRKDEDADLMALADWVWHSYEA